MSTRSFQPGDAYGISTTVSNASGALANADSTPTATLYRNGTADGAVTLTVANPATGAYSVSGTIPGTYAVGDRVSVLFLATVGGVSTGAFLDHVRLVGYPNTALPNAAAAGAGGLPVLDGSAHLLAYSVAQPVTVNAINGLAPPANWNALTIAGGKVAATVAAGDSADATSIKATIGTAGAGLTSIPYTGPAALTDYQQRGVAVTLPSPAPAGYGGTSITGPVDANIVSIAGSTQAATNLHDDELATAPTIPTAAQNAAAVWDLATTGHETTGSFGALVAAGGGGGTATVDYAAMETYFAAHGGLSANTIAIAGSAPAGINLRDDELATAPTLPAVDSQGRVTVGTNSDKLGYSLSASGLDSIATTPVANGVTPNFRQMVVATWRRWFRRHVASGSTLTGYADDGTTVLTTQSIPAVDSPQTQGPSA